MMAMTTSSSINVKAGRTRRIDISAIWRDQPEPSKYCKRRAGEAADEIAAEEIVATRVVAENGRRSGAAVHRLVARVGRKAVLGGHGEHRAVPRMAGNPHAGSAPGLLQVDRLPGQRVDSRLRRV